MISRNQISFIKSLHQKKFRDRNRLFIAEGPKIIDELLHSGWYVELIAASESFSESRKTIIEEKDIELISISPRELERISTLTSPNSVLAIVKYPESYPHSKPEGKGLILAIDGISDPGNFGTIIRTADWFGIDQIVCSESTVDLFNPKVIQSTMGSFTRVAISYTNLLVWISESNLESYGAVMDGENLYFTGEPPENSILVIGNESHGLGSDLLKAVDHRISIPSQGIRAESLNAAIATSIIISEFVRKINWA